MESGGEANAERIQKVDVVNLASGDGAALMGRATHLRAATVTRKTMRTVCEKCIRVLNKVINPRLIQ